MDDIKRFVQVEETLDQTVVTISGEPDHDQFGAVIDKVYELARSSSKDVKLDVSAVDFIPSTSLGALVALDKNVSSLGRQLTLAQPSPSLGELLEITGLDSILQVEAW